MENLKDVGKKVAYPIKGPLEMDNYGYVTISCATTPTTPMENNLNVDVTM
jgi:flavoprotein